MFCREANNLPGSTIVPQQQSTASTTTTTTLQQDIGGFTVILAEP
jgi:hypothetical protein